MKHNNCLEENQAGFSAGYSTTDHIFTLHALTELLISKHKNSVVHSLISAKCLILCGLKLIKNGVNGIFFRIVYSLYQNIKSCIVFSGSQSSVFQSYCGVHQGENLSPALFSLFLNDLEDFLNAHHCEGISVDYTDEDIRLYLKILILLYADDTVIFGTDPHSFQDNLNIFYEYCQLWELNINYNKTKIMILGMRNTNNLHFTIGRHDTSICNELKYLRVIISNLEASSKLLSRMWKKQKKAMHLLYKRIICKFLFIYKFSFSTISYSHFTLWTWNLGFSQQ